MNRKFWVGLFLSACILLSSNAFANTSDSTTAETLENSAQPKQAQKLSKAEQAYHLETMSKLFLGYYHGTWKVSEILNMGTIIDNPKKIDRSLVVFNNKIYQLIEPFPLDAPDTQRTTSLATIHGIDKPIETQISSMQGLGAFIYKLGTEIDTNSKSNSRFYILQMQGEFSNLVLQNIPDRNWVQEQLKGKSKHYPERRYNKLKGTIVGIRMIDYLKSNKSLTWYLHFASEDKTVSGLIVNMNIDQATMKISPISDFSVYMPVWTEDKPKN